MDLLHGRPRPGYLGNHLWPPGMHAEDTGSEAEGPRFELALTQVQVAEAVADRPGAPRQLPEGSH